MERRKLEITEEVAEHIEGFYNVREAFAYYKKMLEKDLMYYLNTITEDEKEIQQIVDAIDSYDDIIKMIEYLTNDEKKTIEDIIRQAYVISDVEIPYERKNLKVKCKLTKEQIQEIEELNVPYSIKEIEKVVNKENDIEQEMNMILANYVYLEKLSKKTKNRKIKNILKVFENEYMPSVPNKEVKEIHVYFPNYDEELLFLDEEGLHQVVGKKAKVEFLDGNRKIGYLGSDFKDKDGDECLGLFESYDESKGFYNYNTYKIKDVLRMDVLYYPREKIDFSFQIKVRHIKKYVKGVTENQNKVKK